MSTLPSNFTCPDAIYEILVELSNPEVSGAEFGAKCPDACLIAWGTGNPDLSGIGAYVSYIIQVVLTLLFQFPFIIFYVFSTNKRRQNLTQLYATFFNTYALFNLSILVAGLVRYTSKTSSGYDLVFINFLAQFVSIGILAVQSTPIIVKLLESLICERGDFIWHFPRPKILLHVFIFLCNFAAAMYRICGNPGPTSFSRLYPKLVVMCEQYENVKQPSGWTGWVWLGSCILVIFTSGALYLLHRRQKQKKKVPKTAIRAVSFSMLLIFILVDVLCVWLFKQLHDSRNDLKDIMGPEFEDNKWGFGQVLAIFLWAEAVASIIWHAGRATVKKTRTWTLVEKTEPGTEREQPPGSLPSEATWAQPPSGYTWEAK